MEVPAESGVVVKGLGVRGAQAQDEVQGLTRGVGRVEAALECALGSIGGGQDGRSALALGLLQSDTLLVNPGLGGGLDGAKELARSLAPLNGESGG